MLGQSSIQVILWQWEQSQDLLRCAQQAGLPELTFAYHIRCQFAAKKVSVFRKPIICCCQIRWRYRAKHFAHQPWPFGHKQSLSQAMLAHFKCMDKSYACLADHFFPLFVFPCCVRAKVGIFVLTANKRLSRERNSVIRFPVSFVYLCAREANTSQKSLRSTIR